MSVRAAKALSCDGLLVLSVLHKEFVGPSLARNDYVVECHEDVNEAAKDVLQGSSRLAYQKSSHA